VKGGVEDGDVRRVGHSGLRLADRAQRRCVVQGRQRPELLDRREHIGVDESRLPESRAPVHDPVSDGLGRLERVDDP
jgi:hypothetical protein